MTMKQFASISAATVATATAFALQPVPSPGEPREPASPEPVAPEPAVPAIEIDSGEPMQIDSYKVEAEVRGLFATVTTTIVFRNPNDRILEGELVFPLPDRAAVCGFALDINGALVDAVVVPKDEARIVFESEVRRGIDPAVVEHVKGNVHRTRIYPLPARGTRTVRLTYNAPIAVADGAARLALRVPEAPLKHLAVVAEVVTPSDEKPVITGIGDAAFAKVENVWRVSFGEDGAAHPDDIAIALPSIPTAYSLVEDAGDCGLWLQKAELSAESEPGKPEFSPAPLDIYWDCSRSAAATAPAALAALKALAPALGTTFRLRTFSSTAGDFVEFATAEALLEAVGAISDYDGATSFAGLFVGADSGRRKVVFSDGLETASDYAGERVENLVAVVVPRTADMAFLRRVTCGRAVAASGLAPDALATAVKAAFLRPASAASGDGDAMELEVGPFRLSLEKVGEKPEGCAAPARGRVTATAWAQVKMEELAGDPSGNEDAMLGLGRRYGLVGPKTSMLVLESLDQWLRYRIEPPKTLPEMRERWLEAMKNRNYESEEAKRERHAANLKSLWNERLAWWRRDFEKDPLPVPKRAANDDEPGILRRAAMAVGSAIVGNRSVERSAARSGMAAPESGAIMMDMAAEEPGNGGQERVAQGGPETTVAPAASISVQPWNPDTPYLKTLKKAGKGERYSTYLSLAKDFGSSPSFFLDCAGFFYDAGEDAVATRVISNLAEIRLESADALRVMAWRLRQAGALDAAIGQFRRIAALRPEDGQSFRDLAMTLAQRAKARLAAGDAAGARADAEETLALYVKTAFTPWRRHADTVCIFALEELNAFISWMKSDGLDWKGEAPSVPDIGEDFLQPIDTDVRIILEWDADNTDLDLHVVEPSGEEAYYAHNRTRRGGMVSRDVTDGFGPEEYMIRKAPNGEYEVFVKYFASHQQTLFGPATATATIFTGWGRADEKSQTLSLRLEKPSEKVKIGAVKFKGDNGGK